MQKISFSFLLAATALSTVRVHHYKPENDSLFADTAAVETLITDAVSPSAAPKTAETENNGEFAEDHPETTANDEETLIEE